MDIVSREWNEAKVSGAPGFVGRHSGGEHDWIAGYSPAGVTRYGSSLLSRYAGMCLGFSHASPAIPD